MSSTTADMVCQQIKFTIFGGQDRILTIIVRLSVVPRWILYNNVRSPAASSSIESTFLIQNALQISLLRLCVGCVTRMGCKMGMAHSRENGLRDFHFRGIAIVRKAFAYEKINMVATVYSLQERAKSSILAANFPRLESQSR